MNNIVKHPVLYKIDSHGNHRMWRIEQDNNQFWTIAGLIDGEQVTSEPRVCKGKNIGRANETSPEDQATAEINAKYTKKLKGDYHIELKNVKTVRWVHPMLAEKFHEFEDKIILPGYVQPKLNGGRCTAQKTGLLTRKGESWISAPHIMRSLEKFFKAFPDAILDGELYCDLFANDLGSTMSLIRKKKPTQADLDASAKVVVFNIFDIIDDGIMPGFENLPFGDRYQYLKQYFDKYMDDNSCIKLVPTFPIADKPQIQERVAEFLEQGFEGGIWRNDVGYQRKRTSDLLKIKNFMDEEFKIIDVLEGEGNRSGMCGAFRLIDKDGRMFKATPKGNREFFREILKNKNDYIGRLATVKFVGYTPVTGKGGGIPFHGNVIDIRDDI